MTQGWREDKCPSVRAGKKLALKGAGADVLMGASVFSDLSNGYWPRSLP